jgi:hypothetical protein
MRVFCSVSALAKTFALSLMIGLFLGVLLGLAIVAAHG